MNQNIVRQLNNQHPTSTLAFHDALIQSRWVFSCVEYNGKI